MTGSRMRCAAAARAVACCCLLAGARAADYVPLLTMWPCCPLLGHPCPPSLLCRLLNALPANRVTATAVDAVLKVVGWRMNTAYRRQFTKLLQARRGVAGRQHTVACD